MPLYEFLRLAIEKLESSQHNKLCSVNPSLENENDLVGGATIERASRSPDEPSAFSDSTLGKSATETTEKCVYHGKKVCDGDTFSSFENGSSSHQLASGAELPSFTAHSLHPSMQEKDNGKGSCQDGLFGNNFFNSFSSNVGLYAPTGLDMFLNRDKLSSSVSSRNSADDDHKASCEEKWTTKRSIDNEESACQIDELQDAKKPCQDQEFRVSKRRRIAEVHNLSERRRRDRINQKMQTLQELIPNCNKADKASMLDEVIEYLKKLKHQVQILSMGSGLCVPVPPLMVGAQHMYYPPIPHFSYMGVRMGSCTSFGYIDAGSPRCPVFPTTAGPFVPICGHLPLTGWGMRPTADPKLNHKDLNMNKN